MHYRIWCHYNNLLCIFYKAKKLIMESIHWQAHFFILHLIVIAQSQSIEQLKGRGYIVNRKQMRNMPWMSCAKVSQRCLEFGPIHAKESFNKILFKKIIRSKNILWNKQEQGRKWSACTYPNFLLPTINFVTKNVLVEKYFWVQNSWIQKLAALIEVGGREVFWFPKGLT